MIRVKFFATLREITGVRMIEIENVNDVRSLLNLLYKKYGDEFKKEIETKNMILVNGKNILDLEGYETRLEEGDEVSIFPPVGGG